MGTKQITYIASIGRLFAFHVRKIAKKVVKKTALKARFYAFRSYLKNKKLYTCLCILLICCELRVNISEFF